MVLDVYIIYCQTMCNYIFIHMNCIYYIFMLGMASIITVIMNLYRDLCVKHVSVLYHTYIMCFVMLDVYIYIYIFVFILYTHYHVISCYIMNSGFHDIPSHQFHHHLPCAISSPGTSRCIARASDSNRCTSSTGSCWSSHGCMRN